MKKPSLPTSLKIAITLTLSMLATPHSAQSQPFIHPGGLHTQADLDRMKTKVAAGEHPWIDGWNLFIQDRKAQNNWKSAAAPSMPSRQRAQDDATAMYYNALRWYISGDTSHADCAVRIANSWSSTANDRPAGDYLSAIPVGSFAIAAELLRLYPGWSAEDQAKFKKILLDYWYPKCDEFLKTHGNSPNSRYWANWDTCNMLAILAIGVFCDDRAKYDQAADYFKNGQGMGAIKNAVPFLYENGLGQWQESGRDGAHAMGGMGELAEFCQIAWNQGQDLFGYDDNRLLKGAEYTAQYTLWKGVPYTFYDNADNARQPYISTNYHGRLQASHFELLYNHYAVLKGLKTPNVKLFAELKRPEDGNVDIFGYGTLTFTLDAKASPFPAASAPPTPLDLTATPGLGRVELQWSPSGAYTAHGYEVLRSTTLNGPWENVYSTREWTTPQFTDTKVENGTTYYYQVAALNQYGKSPNSVVVSSIPIAGGELPQGWTPGQTGTTTYASAAKGSISLAASGTGMGGPTDSFNSTYRTVTGDFTLTARLIDRTGPINMTGLMMRESPANDSRMVALTLGEIGGRQARLRTRFNPAEKTTLQLGNDYTWLPAWFRLQRQGNLFSAFQSSDGITWFEAGKSTIAMPQTYQVGLVATTGNEPAPQAQVTFDNVTGEVAPPPAPSAPTTLKSTIKGNAIQLTWKNTAPHQSGIKIEASKENAPFYEIADLNPEATTFTNTGLQNPKNYKYRIRSYNQGGYSNYSNSQN